MNAESILIANIKMDEFTITMGEPELTNPIHKTLFVKLGTALNVLQQAQQEATA